MEIVYPVFLDILLLMLHHTANQLFIFMLLEENIALISHFCVLQTVAYTV